jgi:apolipoprotein N-acyltransferase
VAGTELTVVEGATGAQGVLICKDMDYPGLVRDYRAAGARLLLVPALDFDRDAWLHSRMAVLRGIETGLPVVRAGRAGAVTVSDAYGRVLTEDRTTGRAEASVVTTAPGATAPTPYALLGDWAAWLCTLVVAAIALVAVRRMSGKPRSGRLRS